MPVLEKPFDNAFPSPFATPLSLPFFGTMQPRSDVLLNSLSIYPTMLSNLLITKAYDDG
jgi:hypothetical protein